MPVLRFFRSTLVTLSIVAFLASVMLLVSSAPIETARMQSAPGESLAIELASMDFSVPEPAALDQAVPEPAARDRSSVELVEPRAESIGSSAESMGSSAESVGSSAESVGPPAMPSQDQLAELQGAIAEMISFKPPVGTLEAPYAGVPVVRLPPVETPSMEASPVQPAVQSVLEGNQILAFYGKPGASSMGILGEYTKEQLAPYLMGYARLYDDANGGMGVVPAFYIIYGTCWPDGEIGMLRNSIVKEYIEFAAERGWLVFLDHQIGKYEVEHAVSSMLPFLRYPNVHLAIDPEWRTPRPLQEIGYVTGEELNHAQALMEAYLVEHDLPGNRMLVFHQFTTAMVRQRDVVDAGFDRVTLVHTADGFGPPALKRHAYGQNAKAINIPVKGFKLFFQARLPGAGWDLPLMLPDEVLALDPMPLVIMYQ